MGCLAVEVWWDTRALGAELALPLHDLRLSAYDAEELLTRLRVIAAAQAAHDKAELETLKNQAGRR